MENWIPVSSTGMTPSCPVHVAINIKKFTKQKKGKRSPSHCLFSEPVLKGNKEKSMMR